MRYPGECVEADYLAGVVHRLVDAAEVKPGEQAGSARYAKVDDAALHQQPALEQFIAVISTSFS